MSIINFISGFIKRGGVAVLLSTALVKFSSAILSIVVVRLLSKEDFGVLSFVLSIYSIAIVIAGFGGNYSLLRYGSITSSLYERKLYYNYTLIHGFKYVAVVGILLCIFSFLYINQTNINSTQLILLIALSLFPFYALEILRSYFRIINQNRLYSKMNVWNSLVLFCLAILLTYILGVYGYVISLILSPLIIFLFYNKRLDALHLHPKININRKEYWAYGLHTSISGIANQIIFSIAPFLLGVLGASEHEIAGFKVATIIPFTLLTLPGILMITDFNYIARNYKNVDLLKGYYRNYLKTIIPISFVIFTLLIIYSDWIIKVIFGSQYIDCVPMYRLFMVSTFVTYIFRNPLGNILLAVGKAQWNGYSTYIFCALYVFSSSILFRFLGTWGVAYCLSATFILSGFVSLGLYRFYINKIQSYML